MPVAATKTSRKKTPAEAIPELGYEIIIHWSADDQAYVADVPELPGCMAHGDTHEEAARQAKEAMRLWLDVARERLREIPIPKGRRLLLA